MTINEQIDYIKEKLRKYTSDKHLIEELTQLISIKLYQKSYNYYNSYQHKRLISLLIRSAYIDYYRANKTNKNNHLLDITNIDIASEEPININSNILFSNLDKLPEKQKDVIILRYYFGLTYEKIAELLNCPKNTALGYFHKAKAKLNQLLTKYQMYEC
jgi:RNA polymerase sigma-70 factor (ECF subfamily)